MGAEIHIIRIKPGICNSNFVYTPAQLKALSKKAENEAQKKREREKKK